jgi:hypothetical protein
MARETRVSGLSWRPEVAYEFLCTYVMSREMSRRNVLVTTALFISVSHSEPSFDALL